LRNGILKREEITPSYIMWPGLYMQKFIKNSVYQLILRAIDIKCYTIGKLLLK